MSAKKLLKGIIALSFTLLTLSAVALEPSLMSAIATYQAKWNEYSLKHDATRLIKLIADTHTEDFLSIDMSDKSGHTQRRTRAQLIGGVKMSMRYMTISQVSTKIISVKRSSGSAVVRTRMSMTGTIPKENSPDGHSYEGRGLEVADATWVLAGGTWKVKISKILAKDFIKIRRS